MSVYLVTGAAGFIGAALAKKMIGLGHEVVTIDNLTTGDIDNIPEQATFVQGNCQDEPVYEQIPRRRYDAIFHIAGQSSGEISFDNPVYDLRTNAESTLHILKFALANGVKRIIYASTMSVYGIQDDKPIREGAVPCPQSFYGVGKLASENYLRLYGQYGLNTTSLRLFNVYGPGQNLENMRQGMVSIFMAQMIREGRIHVKGSPDRFRDFIYIDDVVEAFLACLKSKIPHGHALNIATGTRTTVRHLVDEMVALYGKDVPVTYEGNTSGDIHGIFADIEKAREQINFKAKVKLERGLKHMFDWIMEHHRGA